MSVKRMMRTEEGKLFGEALLEAVTWKLDDTLSQYNETVKATNEHDRRVQKIFRSYILRRRRKIIAAIVAATLLLGGCAVGRRIYKNEMGSFLETIRFNGIHVSYIGDNKSPHNNIENVYEMTYLPEGYELTKNDISKNNIWQIWKNENGEKISFQIRCGTDHYVGVDNKGTSNLFYYNGTEIYRRKANDAFYVNVWIMDSHYTVLSSSYELSEEELGRIIDGIHITMTMEEYEKIQASIIKPGRR